MAIFTAYAITLAAMTPTKARPPSKFRVHCGMAAIIAAVSVVGNAAAEGVGMTETKNIAMTAQVEITAERAAKAPSSCRTSAWSPTRAGPCGSPAGAIRSWSTQLEVLRAERPKAPAAHIVADVAAKLARPEGNGWYEVEAGA
jgi:hypothetical protein